MRQRWKEHFEEIFNRPIPDKPVTNEDAILTDETTIEDITSEHISKAEIRAAIRKLKNGKAGGRDENNSRASKSGRRYNC